MLGASFALVAGVPVSHGRHASRAVPPAALLELMDQPEPNTFTDIAKAALDDNSYRGLTLANGMRVVLVSTLLLFTEATSFLVSPDDLADRSVQVTVERRSGRRPGRLSSRTRSHNEALS